MTRCLDEKAVAPFIANGVLRSKKPFASEALNHESLPSQKPFASYVCNPKVHGVYRVDHKVGQLGANKKTFLIIAEI
jgi:hypothetical protein